MKKLLAAIGKLGKGAATIVGAVLGVGGITLGAATGGNDQLAACVSELMKQPDTALTTIGVAVFLFGVGRKAGWIGRSSASAGSSPS